MARRRPCPLADGVLRSPTEHHTKVCFPPPPSSSCCWRRLYERCAPRIPRYKSGWSSTICRSSASATTTEWRRNWSGRASAWPPRRQSAKWASRRARSPTTRCPCEPSRAERNLGVDFASGKRASITAVRRARLEKSKGHVKRIRKTHRRRSRGRRWQRQPTTEPR